MLRSTYGRKALILFVVTISIYGICTYIQVYRYGFCTLKRRFVHFSRTSTFLKTRPESHVCQHLTRNAVFSHEISLPDSCKRIWRVPARKWALVSDVARICRCTQKGSTWKCLLHVASLLVNKKDRAFERLATMLNTHMWVYTICVCMRLYKPTQPQALSYS